MGADKKFSADPSCIIKKQRMDDINIKAAEKSEQQPVFSSDVRISCSTENPAAIPQNPSSTYVTQERIKERYSFQFTWMRIDFTVTQTNVIRGNPVPNNLSYETELEISDVSWLQEFITNRQAFIGLIRRFVQNAASLTRLLSLCQTEIKLKKE